MPFKVISVGNISSGGVGKSVVSQYIIKNIKFSGAIVLRGYKGRNEKTGKSFVVSDGEKTYCDVDFSGDEAFMFAQCLKVPIVVGSNRYKSGLELKKINKKIDYIVMDDAYQNHKVKKDLEILLLDARNPFDNGHCFPAGMLREKDTSRADVIILTHSDKVSGHAIKNIKLHLPKVPVFSGKHQNFQVLDQDNNESNLAGKKLLAFAGIGTFDGFIDSVRSTGIIVSDFINYNDHHKYTVQDAMDISSKVTNNNLSGAITTRKDWHKVKPLLNNVNLYCLDIKFDFLSQKESVEFFKIIEKVLK